jgi:hypothetical protein
MTQNLLKWLLDKDIPYADMGMGRFNTEIGVCLEIEPDDLGRVVDLRKTPSLILDDYAQTQVDEGVVQYFVFPFGGRFYYTDTVEIKKLKPFRYIGKASWGTPIPEGGRVHMMIHGKYELMCGIGEYEEWAKKGSFLGFDMIGICEKDTLAGAIQFSQACKKSKLKPAIGLTKDFKYGKEVLELRLFACNKIGWESLMYINSQTQLQSIEELIPLIKDIVVIVAPAIGVDKDLLHQLKDNSVNTYYQITTTMFVDENKDIERLNNIKWFLREYGGDVRCIVNKDTYCLEEEEDHLRSILIKQGGKKRSLTKNHHFSTYDRTIGEFAEHFENDKELFKATVYQSRDSMKQLISEINFDIDTKTLHLPAFQMDEEYRDHYDNNEELFKSLISNGLESKIDFIKYDQNVVLERVAREGSLIKRGGFIDYFLILWDIVDWCNKKQIEVGPGRGCFLPGENYVTLSNNEKKLIEDIVEGDLVKNHFFGEALVVETHQYTVDEEIIELIFEDETKISCTKDHKIYTSNRGWVEADNLKNTDEVVFY